MNTFFEDLGEPLDKVERAYIRRPVTIILWPLVVIATVAAAAVGAAIGVTQQWFGECW